MRTRTTANSVTNSITVMYRVFERDRVTTKEMTFSTEAKMLRWIEKQEKTNGNWIGVVAYAR